jgi:cardiolipin synthase (CMP-forming)
MLGQLKSAPNQLTLLRLVFIPFIASAILDRQFKLAFILFVLAGLSDGLDGVLARAMNQRTMLGQYLDPIADKLLLSTMFLVLSFANHIPVADHPAGLQP